ERFEWLEGQGASETRPTHVAAPADWFGVADVVGALVTDGWFGRTQVVLAAIDWDHVGTGERPLAVREGWSVVDRIDVADTASERAHAWTAAATAALVGRDVTRGLVLDGGRTIDAGDATFTIARTP